MIIVRLALSICICQYPRHLLWCIHPIRDLFLGHYLNGRTRDNLPTAPATKSVYRMFHNDNIHEHTPGFYPDQMSSKRISFEYTCSTKVALAIAKNARWTTWVVYPCQDKLATVHLAWWGWHLPWSRNNRLKIVQVLTLSPASLDGTLSVLLIAEPVPISSPTTLSFGTLIFLSRS